MCINCKSKVDMFGTVAFMTFMAGIGISIPLMALALVQESEKEKYNKQRIQDLWDRLNDLEINGTM